MFLFFKQKTAYEMRISDWSSDVCSSDLAEPDQRLLTERKRFEFRIGKFVHHVRPHQLDRPVDNRRRQQFVDYLQKPRVEVAAAITQLFIGPLEQRVVVEVEREDLPGVDLAQHAQIDNGRAPCRERGCRN